MQQPVPELADELRIPPHLAHDLGANELEQVVGDLWACDPLEQRLLEGPPDHGRDLGEPARAPAGAHRRAR